MRTLKLALLLGMLAGCAPQIDRAEQELDVSPPLQRASLTTVREGGESPHSVLEIYPQQGQRLQDLVDLEIFRDLQPGLTFVEAEKLIGPPQERGTNNRGPYVIYHRAEGRVQIALQEYASGSASYRAWTLDGFPIRTLPGSVLHPRIVELLPADQKVEVVIMGSPLGLRGFG